uniref:Uncharacterized protein n=1 Tax=Ditylenchus dipsaci TaxID=166011 RepID=A0A915DJG4_9BILA
MRVAPDLGSGQSSQEKGKYARKFVVVAEDADIGDVLPHGTANQIEGDYFLASVTDFFPLPFARCYSRRWRLPQLPILLQDYI